MIIFNLFHFDSFHIVISVVWFCKFVTFKTILILIRHTTIVIIMWSRRAVVTLLKSIALPRQLQSYPQFSIFCDACQLKINRRSRQLHSSSANLGKKLQHSNEGDLDDEDDEGDNEDDSARCKYHVISFTIHLHKQF